MTDNMLAWHYTTKDRRCRFGDGREDKGVGTTLTVDCEPRVCEAGLHGSEKLLDALQYAGSCMVRRVRLSGAMDHDMDKTAATARTILAEPGSIEEAEYAHSTFARLAAAEVLQYWDAPDVVLEYLGTGDPELVGAARDAALVAARDAARAAWDAAWAARDAARDDLNNLAEDVIPAILGWDMEIHQQALDAIVKAEGDA